MAKYLLKLLTHIKKIIIINKYLKIFVFMDVWFGSI